MTLDPETLLKVAEHCEKEAKFWAGSTSYTAKTYVEVYTREATHWRAVARMLAK